jgi:hypothetical protein
MRRGQVGSHNMHNMECECIVCTIQDEASPLEWMGSILPRELLLELPDFLLQLLVPILKIPDSLPEPLLHLFARGDQPFLAQKLFRDIVEAVERGRERVVRRRQMTWRRYERVYLGRSAIHYLDRLERLAESRATRFGVTPWSSSRFRFDGPSSATSRSLALNVPACCSRLVETGSGCVCVC